MTVANKCISCSYTCRVILTWATQTSNRFNLTVVSSIVMFAATSAIWTLTIVFTTILGTFGINSLWQASYITILSIPSASAYFSPIGFITNIVSKAVILRFTKSLTACPIVIFLTCVLLKCNINIIIICLISLSILLLIFFIKISTFRSTFQSMQKSTLAYK